VTLQAEAIPKKLGIKEYVGSMALEMLLKVPMQQPKESASALKLEAQAAEHVALLENHVV